MIGLSIMGFELDEHAAIVCTITEKDDNGTMQQRAYHTTAAVTPAKVRDLLNRLYGVLVDDGMLASDAADGRK